MARVLSQREENLVWLTGFLLIVGAIIIFIIKPLLYEDRSLSREIHGMFKQVSLCQRVLPLLKKNVYGEGETVTKKTARTSDGSVMMLAELELLAKNAGVLIIDMRPQPMVQADVQYKESKFELRFEGSIESIIRYIHSLSGSVILFSVNRMQISPKARSNLLESALEVTGMIVQ